jgi:sec-independent protein translocase protein TatB
MFEIGWSEILVIAVVAIVVIGPKDLPRVMRTVGQWAGKMKRMGREFQNQFQEALREAELDDVRKDIADIMSTDPLGDVKKEMTKVESGLKDDLAKSAEPMTIAPAPVAEASATVAAETTEAVASTAAAIEPEPAGATKAAS